MEKAAQSDEDYMSLIPSLKTCQLLKSLPAQSEGQKMSREWTKLSLMLERDLVLMEDQVIIVLEGYRQTVCKMFHETSHQCCETMFHRLRRYNMWPGMRMTIQEYTKKSQVCLQFQPSKERAKSAGLPVSFADLNPMDWVMVHMFAIKGSNF